MSAPDPDPGPLATRLRREPGLLCAVVDGAILDDAPAALTACGLDPMPLYIDPSSRIAVPAGPQMAMIHTADQRDRLMTVPGIAAALVVWALPADRPASPDTVFAHLRGLTLVLTPAQADANRGGPDTPDTEALYFRHADPEVMARVFPCLTASQRRRLMGPAHALIFLARFSGGLRHFLNDAGDDPHDHRRLRLTQAQYDRIVDGYRDTLLARAIHTFRPHTDDPDRRIRDAFDRAEGYGISDQSGIFDFIAADLAQGADFERQPRFRFVRDTLEQRDTPGAQKIALMQTEIVQAMKRART